MGNILLIPLIYSLPKIKGTKINCSEDITPFILGSSTCNTEVHLSDIDYSQDNIVIGGTSQDPLMVNNGSTAAMCHYEG